MIEIQAQYNGLVFSPFTLDDNSKARNFGINQVVKLKIYGHEKPRSYQQLKLYWDRCNYVAQMLSDHENQVSREDIDFECKIRVAKQHPSMIKRFKSVDGMVFMEPISIAFHNMKHLTACKYFDLAFPIMAGMIGITTEELLSE